MLNHRPYSPALAWIPPPPQVTLRLSFYSSHRRPRDSGLVVTLPRHTAPILYFLFPFPPSPASEQSKFGHSSPDCPDCLVLALYPTSWSTPTCTKLLTSGFAYPILPWFRYVKYLLLLQILILDNVTQKRVIPLKMTTVLSLDLDHWFNPFRVWLGDSPCAASGHRPQEQALAHRSTWPAPDEREGLRCCVFCSEFKSCVLPAHVDQWGSHRVLAHNPTETREELVLRCLGGWPCATLAIDPP